MIRKFLLVSGACGLLVIGCGSDGQSDNHGDDVQPTNQLGEPTPSEGDGDTKPDAPAKPEQDNDIVGQIPDPVQPEEDDLLQDDAMLGEDDTTSKPEEGDAVVTPEEDDVVVVKPEPGQSGEPVRDDLIQNEPMQDEPMQDEPMQNEPMQDEPMQDEPMQDEPMQDEPMQQQSRAIDSGLLERVEVTQRHRDDVENVLTDASYAELKDLVKTRVSTIERMAETSLDAEERSSLALTLDEMRAELEGLDAQSAELQNEGIAKIVAAIDEIESFIAERHF